MRRFVLLFFCACHGSGNPTATTTASAPPPTTAPATAEIGKPAPDFALNDLENKPFSLAAQRGKIIVLEWFNPNCPFVKRNHEQGPLKDMAKRITAKGIVWVSINSGAQGKQGFGLEANQAGKARYAMENAILLDPTGELGHKYGARTTPHMFVIDAAGTLAYRGAIDNAQDGDTDQGAPFVNYVDNAIADLTGGKPVRTPETKSYGCTVKYAD